MRFLEIRRFSNLTCRSAGFHQPEQLRPALQDPVEFLGDVGEKAVGAVLDPVGGIGKLTAAFVVQNVEGTVAEQTIEPFWICTAVAGEIFTVAVAEETMIMLHSMLISKIDKLPPVRAAVCLQRDRKERKRMVVKGMSR